MTLRTHILFKDSVIYGIASSVQKLVPVFIIPIITSYLGKDALKIYDVAFVYAYLFSWFIILGQDSAASVFYFDAGNVLRDKVLAYSFFIQVGSLIAGLLLLHFFKDKLGSVLFHNDEAISKFWMLALWIIPGHVLLNYGLNILQWEMKSISYFFICITNTLCTIGLIFFFIVFKKGDLTALFSVYIAVTSATAVIALWLVRKKIFVDVFPLRPSLVKKLLLFGLPFALFSFLHQAIPALDRFFLLKYDYDTQLPEYSLAVKLGGCVTLVTGSFAMAFSPYAFRLWNQAGAEKKISELFKVIFIVFLLIVPVLLIFKVVLIQVFADNSYLLAASLLPFFFLGWVFDLFTYFSMLGVYKSKSGIKAFWVLLITMIVTCLLNMSFIPYWGLFGAAAAFLVSKMFLFFINLFFSRKIFHIHIYPKLFFPLLAATGLLCYLSTILNTYVYALVTVGFVVVVLANKRIQVFQMLYRNTGIRE